MGDKTLVYKSIGSARTKADREDIDNLPIRDFMPLPYEGVVELVSRLGASDSNLDEIIRELNEQYWTENLKNVTLKPAERKDAQFMQQNYQWECRRLAGFTRQEKVKKQKANFGTLENIYSVVQRLPPEIWNALTGSEEDLTDKAPEELGIIHRDSLEKSDWVSNLEVMTDKIVWTFSKGGEETSPSPSPSQKKARTVIAAKKALKSGITVGIDKETLEIRKYGAYLGTAEDTESDFRPLSTSIQSPKFSMDIFPSEIVGDDFALIGGVEVTDKYTEEIVACIQFLLNLFKDKGYTVTRTRPKMTKEELETVFRGKKYANGYQNLLSRNAIDVLTGLIDEEATIDEKDERERVYGEFLYVLKDEKIAGLCWVKKYDRTNWGEWFQRSLNIVQGPTPPYTEDFEVQKNIFKYMWPANSIYLEVCYLEDRRLSHALNVLAMILYGSNKESIVSNIAPDMPCEDGEFLLWDDDYGPRIIPDHQTVLLHDTLLGYQKSFDLRYNITPDKVGDPMPTLEEIYHVKSLDKRLLSPPAYSFTPKQKENPQGITIAKENKDLVSLLWDKDLMLFNNNWGGRKKNDEDSLKRSLVKLVYNEIEAQDYDGGNVKSGKGEYRLYDIEPETEAYEVKNNKRESATNVTITKNIIEKNGKYKATRHRNGTLSPRLFHYEMFRFLPNLKELRTICGLLKSQVKSARSTRLQGGESESVISDFDVLVERMKTLEGGSIEPIVEMDMDVDVSAGFTSDAEMQISY